MSIIISPFSTRAAFTRYPYNTTQLLYLVSHDLELKVIMVAGDAANGLDATRVKMLKNLLQQLQ